MNGLQAEGQGGVGKLYTLERQGAMIIPLYRGSRQDISRKARRHGKTPFPPSQPVLPSIHGARMPDSDRVSDLFTRWKGQRIKGPDTRRCPDRIR